MSTPAKDTRPGNKIWPNIVQAGIVTGITTPKLHSHGIHLPCLFNIHTFFLSFNFYVMTYTYTDSRHVLLYENGCLLGTFFVWCDGMCGELHERYFVEVGSKTVYLDAIQQIS